MKLIKSYLKKLYRNKLFIYLRNFTGIKPPIFLISLNQKNISTSDAFFWRTDNGYTTVFKYSDLLCLYYQEESGVVEILFYDKNNKLIKTKNYSSIEISNEVIIDKNFFDGLEDYGVFYIFHKSNKKTNSIIRNSCYTGYYKNNCIPSFVHGNLITSSKSFDGDLSDFGIIGVSKFKKKIYKVQNYFNFKKTELAIMNPTKNKLEIIVNNNKINLDSCCSKILDIGNDQTITINSKCYLLRPIIFDYKNNYIDVYHG